MDPGAQHYHRYLAGDDEGLVDLVRDYKDGLTLFLCRFVGDPATAEDLTEDTFVLLVTRRPRFVPRHSFKTWLYTIGRNLALNYLKRSRRIADTPIEALAECLPDAESVEAAWWREEEKRLLHRALSRIRADYATALHLKYFEEMDNAQIAAVLHKSRRQVENMLYQAKLALRSELEQEGFSHEELS